MSALLIQSSTGSLQFYLETTGGTPATGLATTDVQVDLKKSDDAFFVNKSLTPDTNATADIGGGANGTVTVAVPGSAGDLYTIEVVVPGGTSALSVDKSSTTVTVNLAVSAGVPVAASNTATLVAAAINDLDSEMTATASGTGADPLTSAEGPTSLSGGADGDWTELGAGFYELDLTAADTDTLGSFAVRVTGTTIRSSLETATVVVATPSSPTPSQTVPTTTLFGYLYDAEGEPLVGASIGVRVLSQPTVLHPGTEGLVVSTGLVSTETDSTGYFTVTLVAGTAVDVFIPAANYRRTITVPSTSSNLFDIP